MLYNFFTFYYVFKSQIYTFNYIFDIMIICKWKCINMKKSLFKNTIYKSILSFVNIVVPLLVGPYVVKLLDVELYGIYNTVYSEAHVFLVFASFGIYSFGMREISRIRNDRDKVSDLFSNLFAISIITNSIILAIYIIYALLTSSGVTTILYFIMGIQFVGNALYVEFINEALENYSFITTKTVIIKILYLISIFLFVKQPNHVEIYAVIISMVVFLNNLISFIYAKKYIKFNFKSIKPLNYIKPLFVILIITNIDLLYSQLDRVMLGKFVNGVAVSLYYIPYYIVSTLAAIPYSIINVSIPRLTYVVSNEGKEQYENNLNKIISSLLFVIVPMCFGVFVLAKEIIYLYAGENYMSCVIVLMLACITRIILSFESILTNLVMYPNRQEKKLLKFSLVCGLLNLILNFALVIFKILTPLTAMITTTLSDLLLTIIQHIYIKNQLKFSPALFTKTTLKYFILSICFIPIAGIVKYINFGFWVNLILIITFCVLIYAGVLFYVRDENIIIIKNKLLSFLRRFKHE